MKKIKGAVEFCIYILFMIIYLVYLMCSKNTLEAILLLLFLILFVFAYKLEKKRFVNSEIQSKMGDLKSTLVYLIVISLVFVFIMECFFYLSSTNSFLESMISLSIVIILCWILIYKIGSTILTEINPKKKSLFFGEFIESIFGNITNLAAVILVISYIFFPFYPVSEPLSKIAFSILALILPAIKMYNFILSEYYEYEKEKPVNSLINKPEVVKNEMNIKGVEKKQYKVIKYFVNNVATIEDLDNLEKIIIKKRNKLEKKQYKVVKYFVNNVATIEDLDNLEKIIAEQRSELESSNDVEKHMD